MDTREHRDRPAHRGPNGSNARLSEANVLEAIRANPYTALGAAAAAGFVLGGGLFSRLGMHLLAVGFRAVLIPAATKLLLDGVEDERHPDDVDRDDETPT
jgi:hypothetical protein